MTALPIFYPDTDQQAWPRLRFAVLGGLSVDGSPGPTARLMRKTLALLMVHPGVPVQLEVLIEELWANRPPKKALQNIQTYVYHARQKLPGLLGDIHYRGGSYLLDVDPLTVDVKRFDHLTARARSHVANRENRLASDALTAAFSLWRGTPLADVDCGPVLGDAVIGMRERYRTAMALRIDLDLQSGRHREIVDELAALCRAEPTREDTAAKLMLALHRSHRRSEALDAYRRLRHSLVEDLGLEPCGELQRLHQQILAGDPALDLEAR